MCVCVISVGKWQLCVEKLLVLGVTITRKNKNTHCDKCQARLHKFIFRAIAGTWNS